MRVYQIAKKHNKETREILEILQKAGIKDKKSVSGLTEEEEKIVNMHFRKEEKPAKKVKPLKPEKKKSPALKKKPEKKKEPELQKEKEEEKKEKAVEKISVKADKSAVQKPEEKKISIEGTENIKILAEKLDVTPSKILEHLLSLGLIANINQSPGKETIKSICRFFGYSAEITKPAAHAAEVEKAEEEKLIPRAPVVTLMGHVDHGKTTILDAIRKSSIVEKEFGQITQKIGAYKLHLPEGSIVFLDTPGHEAFTAMRARGALVTDIVILVVAADDGIKPQTVEAINHAKSAKVPIIVALNKIDKPNINIDRVKKQFSEHGLSPEDWGGDTVFVNVSAINNQGIRELLDMILLMGEMLELKADACGKAEGTVIESFMDKAKGPITTVLIQKGQLKTGDSFIVGKTCGKVRAMMDDWHNKLSVAGPSTPVEILGTQNITNPGDKFQVMDSEKSARKKAEDIRSGIAEKTTEVKKITLEDLYAEIKKGTVKEINLIIKTDYVGSIEAIKDVIGKIPASEINISILHSEAGPISESDILLASASNAIVIGFNVPLTKNVEDIAREEKVEVRTYKIIYELAEDIKNAVEGLLQPEEKEVMSGQAMVKQVFKLSDNSAVAGCIVLEGRIIRNSSCRVIRNGSVVCEGKIVSLKRFKENVREVKLNTECGIGMDNFNNFEERDIIQSYTNVKVTKRL
ncbi:MAG TPA: translation initiation factor IF-2 [bacterium]|nr:translation initiation factor IF-2 [bacterium]